MEKYISKNNYIHEKLILINLKLLIIFIPIAVFKNVDWFRANQDAWLKLFVLVGITLWTLKCLIDKKIIWKKSETNLYIFLFILMMSISLLISKHTIVSLRDYITFISYFFIYFLILNNIGNRKEFDSFIILFFIISFLVSLYTIFHYYGFILYLKEFGPVISTIGQKNWTSNYLALIFPLMFSYFLIEKSKRKKKFYFVALSIVYATLMICQSRGIWISISLTSIFAIYISFKFKIIKILKENQKWLILLILTFVIITIIYSTDNLLNKSAITVTERAMSTFDEKDPSINTRVLMWKNTLKMIQSRPLFGLGIGTFKMNYLDYQAEFLRDNPYYLKYWAHAGEAHNEYLQIGAELGIIGLGIFLSIIFIFYNLILKYLKKESRDNEKIIVFGLLMGITCFLIHSLFSFPLHVPALGSAFFIIVGLTIVYLKDFRFSKFGNSKKGNKNVIKRQSSRLTILFSILILLVTIFVIDSLVIRPYLAEVYAYKGRENLAFAKYNNALSDFEYAAKLDPYNGRILLNLGATYYNLGFFEEVEKTLQQSKEYYNDRNIYRNLGLCYMKLERFQEAEEEFKHAIYLDPKFTKAYFDLGSLYFKKENYEKASEQWNKILEIELDFPNKYIVLNNLGIVYQK
ncbi:O-antigen ligase family protein, partial [bacterium]|nr:O-antigen ligase family protein [bacterium]